MTTGRLPSVEGGIQPTIVDAKGDLITATAADTPARIAVGANDTVLTADSSTSTGLKWATPASGMTNPMTTTGDTIYSSSGSTPARLGIGSTGNVLTVAGGVPTWAAPTAAGTNWTAVNSGGTNLTGATTITISGISGADQLFVYVTNGSAGANNVFTFRINGDSATNYTYGASILKNPSSYSTSSMDFSVGTPDSAFRLCRQQSGTGGGQFVMNATITGGNSSGAKVFTSSSGGESVDAEMVWIGGTYSGTSTISSISIISNGSNFDNGKIYVFKSA
jgi:hypothetical protein